MMVSGLRFPWGTPTCARHPTWRTEAGDPADSHTNATTAEPQAYALGLAPDARDYGDSRCLKPDRAAVLRALTGHRSKDSSTSPARDFRRLFFLFGEPVSPLKGGRTPEHSVEEVFPASLGLTQTSPASRSSPGPRLRGHLSSWDLSSQSCWAVERN